MELGAYFSTICAYWRRCVFGEILDGTMVLSRWGQIASVQWIRTEQMRAGVTVDEFVVMPNHLHGIVFIDARRGTLLRAPVGKREAFGKPVSNSVPTIVRGYKATVTKQINELRGMPGLPVWQRNYYEHVIRNEEELGNIRQYICDNPWKWNTDEENPMNIMRRGRARARSARCC